MDAAAEAFLKTLEANPENVEAYRLLGCVYHLQGEYYEAALCYLQAFRLNSADADTMNNLGVLLYQVGLKEEAERMFKKGLNLKIYHLELNYNFLNCHLLKEEYMMAENLIQRFEAFMGKSPLLYEKHAILNYKMNRLTLALFDIESALSLDKNHSDALYLKSLIFLREEDFQAAINAVLEAAKISPRYTGLAFFLAMDERQRVSSGEGRRADAGRARGRSHRASPVRHRAEIRQDQGIARIRRRKGHEEDRREKTRRERESGRRSPPAATAGAKTRLRADAGRAKPPAAACAGDDSAHALIEALSDISLEEDDRAMTIQSSIKELGLFDLFQVLHINKKTGRLMVTDGPDGKEAQIIFRSGDTCFAVIHDRVPKTIETLLVEWGVIDDGSIARVENALPQVSDAHRLPRGRGHRRPRASREFSRELHPRMRLRDLQVGSRRMPFHRGRDRPAPRHRRAAQHGESHSRRRPPDRRMVEYQRQGALAAFHLQAERRRPAGPARSTSSRASGRSCPSSTASAPSRK